MTRSETREFPTRQDLRIAVVCDFAEEGWPSMDLVGEMLSAGLNELGHGISAALIRPRFRRFFSTPESGGGLGRSTDLVINRFWRYRRALRPIVPAFDFFHIVDHSYAHLAHELPAERTIVTCHDLDTFRCLLEPSAEPRSLPFRLMTRRILSGFRRAAAVVCDSEWTRQEIRRHRLVPDERLIPTPIGVDAAALGHASAETVRGIDGLLGAGSQLNLLHVGSTIPRKRIDVLLRVFRLVRDEFPEARLIRVGGDFDAEQKRLATTLGVADHCTTLPFLSREQLGEIYRRCAVLLLPSEREGFGLPVVEALACGTPVVASDIPVLREIGGEVVSHCAIGKPEEWASTVGSLLRMRRENEAGWADLRARGRAHAAQFSWSACARRMATLYRSLIQSR